MKNLLIRYSLSLAVVSSAISATAAEIDWKADLDYTVAALEAIHPNPWHRIQREAFQRDAAALRSQLGGLSDDIAAVRLAGLVSRIQDGHTGLDLRGVIDFTSWYPVRLDRFPEGIGVVAAGPENEALLGALVVEIDGRPAVDVWNLVESFMSGDNDHSRMSNARLFMSSASYLAAIGVGTEGFIDLVWMAKDGSRRTTRLEAVEAEGADWFLRTSGPPGGGQSLPLVTGEPREIPFRNPGLPYWTALDESGQLYAAINQVQNSDQPVDLNGTETSVSLAGLYEHIFALIDAGKVKTLVIDLRRNGGGNNSLAIPLVDGLAARPEINSKGRLFVLTSGTTFSAAMNLVSMLESRTEAIFVGTPPGGSPLHYGDSRPVTLPSSGLRLRISTLHWDLGVSPWDVRNVMEVDLAAPMTLKALRDGRDPALEVVRSYRDGSILSDELVRIYKSDGLDEALEAARAAHASGDSRWSSVMEQLTDFGWKVIRSGGSGADIYAAFRAVANLYPDHFFPWFTLGRIYLWPGNWTEAHSAFARASKLNPANDMVRRMTELSARSMQPEN